MDDEYKEKRLEVHKGIRSPLDLLGDMPDMPRGWSLMDPNTRPPMTA